MREAIKNYFIAKLLTRLDGYEHELVREMLDGWKWKASMQELDGFLRSKIKYEDVESIDIEILRTKIFKLLDYNNLKLWD